MAAAMLVLASCKQKSNEVSVDEITTFEEVAVNNTRDYPEALAKVIEVHGGLDRWDQMNSLTFTLDKESGTETHTISLKDRQTRIDGPGWTIGADGKTVWLAQDNDSLYKGNPRFYHNLYFYFYAMPFVLADEGIRYSEADPLEKDGVSYPGINISYEDGVGDSSKDQYVLYYDPETYVMKWLAYTVTYKTGESSDNWRFIKYSKWSPVDGLTLPEQLTWYNLNDGLPTEPRNELTFGEVLLSEEAPDTEIFVKPEDALVVER